jgi:hypothetical protein
MLRRTTPDDVRANKPAAVRNITKWRNSVLAALRDPSLEHRALAMTTLTTVLHQWVDLLNHDAKPERPSINRDSSFRMGFEDVFEGSEDNEEQELIQTRNMHPDIRPTDEAAAHIQMKATPYCVAFDGDLRDLLRGDKEKQNGDIGKYPPHGTTEKDLLSEEDVKYHVVQFYLGLLRCIGDYPWRDVRKASKELIKVIETTKIDLPQLHFIGVQAPSLFIPVTDTIGLRSFPSHAQSPFFDMSSGSQTGVDFGDEDENSRIVEDYFAISFAQKSESSGLNMPSHRVPDSPQIVRSNGSRVSFPSIPVPRSIPGKPNKPKFPTESALNLYLELFRSYGRITNLYKVFSFCPKFAHARTDLIAHVNEQDYSVPIDQRIYLGIMAAAEQKCQYYLSILQYDFLQVRGDPAWLEGLHAAPPKFQALARLNKMLAHQPWSIPQSVISDCITARWNEADLILAICVFSFYHTQSALVMSCGVLPEVDLPGGTVKTGKQRDYAHFEAVGTIVNRTRRKSFDVGSNSAPGSYVPIRSIPLEAPVGWPQNVPSTDHEKFILDFQSEDSEEILDMADFDFSRDCCSILGNHFRGFDLVIDNYIKTMEHVSCESGEPTFTEVLRKLKRRLGSLSRITSSLNLSQLSQSSGSKVSFDLPSPAEHLHTPSHSRRASISTPTDPNYAIKEAIWNYSLRLLSISKSDYHYQDTSLLLARSTRQFIRRVCLAPWQSSQADWLGIEGDGEEEEGISMSARGKATMSVEEKTMVAIIASQARFMGQIILGIKSIEDNRLGM